MHPRRQPSGATTKAAAAAADPAAGTNLMRFTSTKSATSKDASGSGSEAESGSPLIGSRVHRRVNPHAAAGADADEQPPSQSSDGEGSGGEVAADEAAAAAAERHHQCSREQPHTLPEVTNRLARLERQMLAQRNASPTRDVFARSPDRAALRRTIQDLRSDVRNAASRGEAEGHMLLARMAALEAAFGQREAALMAAATNGPPPPRRARSVTPSHPSPTRASPATLLGGSPGLVPRSVAAAAAAAATGWRIGASSPEPFAAAAARTYAGSPPPPGSASSPSAYMSIHAPPAPGLLESLASQQQLLQRQVDAALAVQGADITNLAVAVGEIDDANRQVAGAVVEVGCAVEGLMQRLGVLEEGVAAVPLADEGAEVPVTAEAAASQPTAASEQQVTEMSRTLRRLDRRVKALEQQQQGAADDGGAAPALAASGHDLASAVGECRALIDQLQVGIQDLAAQVGAQTSVDEAAGDAIGQLQLESGRLCGALEALAERVDTLDARVAAAEQARGAASASEEDALSERVAALLESRLEALVAQRVEAALASRGSKRDEMTSAAGAAPSEAHHHDKDDLCAIAESASAGVARAEAALVELLARVDRVAARTADAQRGTDRRLDELSSQLSQLNGQVVGVNEGSAAVEDVDALKEAVSRIKSQMMHDREFGEATAAAAARTVIEEVTPRLRADAATAAEAAAECVASGAAASAARNAVARAMVDQERSVEAVATAAVAAVETRLAALEQAHGDTVEQVTEHVAAAGEKLQALEADASAQATVLRQSIDELVKEVAVLREDAANRRVVEREAQSAAALIEEVRGSCTALSDRLQRLATDVDGRVGAAESKAEEVAEEQERLAERMAEKWAEALQDLRVSTLEEVGFCMRWSALTVVALHSPDLLLLTQPNPGCAGISPRASGCLSHRRAQHSRYH